VLNMSLSGRIPYSSQEELVGAIGTHVDNGDGSDSGGAAYASPASTVSPGRSHGNSPLGKPVDVPMQNLPISGSSELAHALQPAHDQVSFKPDLSI
jgi:hypothetical protein